MMNNLPIISARKIMMADMDTLWDQCRGQFALKFDDGEVIETNGKETLYSRVLWLPIIEYPDTPLLSRHHIKRHTKNGLPTSSTHAKILTEIAKDVVKTYKLLTPESMKLLRKLIFGSANLLYNEFTLRASEFVTNMDITDFIEVMEHPRIVSSYKKLKMMEHANETISQRHIDKHYQEILDVLQNDTSMKDNTVAFTARVGLANSNQILQMVGPRGFLTDVDSVIFQVPVLRGYIEGFRTLYESGVESRSASKSIYFSEDPLKDSEYFARRLQILSMVVKNVHLGDCGSTKVMPWLVKPKRYNERGEVVYKGDLPLLVGKKYIDEEGHINTISKNDDHLVGKIINLRTAMGGCQHPDPHGVCSTCFGDLYQNLPEKANVGHACSATLTRDVSQITMSVKHYDGSSNIEPLALNSVNSMFFVVGDDFNSYYLRSDMQKYNLKMIVPIDAASSLMELTSQHDIEHISINRVTEISSLAIEYDDSKGRSSIAMDIAFNSRRGILSRDFLHYIFDGRIETDGKKNFIFDLKEWDCNKPIIVLPYKHFNMAALGKEVAKIVESSVEKLTGRDEIYSAQETLEDLFDTVNSKMNVNIALLEVILYSVMVVDANKNDFRLPKANSPSEMSVAERNISRRSLGGKYAFEKQDDAITDPFSFFNINRVDHPMDAFVKPHEFVNAYGKNPPPPVET